MKTSFIQFLLIFSVLSLLFFPQTSVQGAKNGLILWSATITPTLLPFLLLTGFMQYYQTFHLISRLFTPSKNFFLVSMRTFLHLYSRFFCGCPLGAKIIDDFISCGSFTKSEGEKLLYTCNQISPMFSAGYTLTLILHGKISALRFFFLPVFSCHVLSDLSGLFIFYKRFSTYTPIFSHHCTKKSADQVIFDSLHSIFMIGICIMIFSIAVSLLEILPLPFYLKRGLTAVLEITNAISHFGSSHMSIGRKVILLCMITSFWRVVCCRADFKCIQKEQTLPSGNICS